MAENKTKTLAASPDSYVAAIEDETRRSDCATLMALMAKVTKQAPVMWGTAIVGYGVHRYPLAGGKTGEICAVGFSSRKAEISVYGVTGGDDAAPLLERLGKHKLGKGCLYIGRMGDINAKVLEKLVLKAFKAKQA